MYDFSFAKVHKLIEPPKRIKEKVMEIRRLLSLFLFSCYLSLLFALFGNAFHLYQPTWAAYPCLHDDVGYLWIELLHHLLYGVVI